MFVSTCTLLIAGLLYRSIWFLVFGGNFLSIQFKEAHHRRKDDFSLSLSILQPLDS